MAQLIRCISDKQLPSGEEVWVGLEQLHFLTRQKTYKLRVRLTDQDGIKGEANFNYFDLNKVV